MAYIFTAHDPKGTLIGMKENTWNMKICNYDGANDANQHGNSHPEMEVLLDKVQDSIKHPHFIIKDNPHVEMKENKERYEYYKFYFNVDDRMRGIKTVVEIDNTSMTGEVVTTHKISGNMNKIKKEGEIVYDASNTDH